MADVSPEVDDVPVKGVKINAKQRKPIVLKPSQLIESISEGDEKAMDAATSTVDVDNGSAPAYRKGKFVPLK